MELFGLSSLSIVFVLTHLLCLSISVFGSWNESKQGDSRETGITLASSPVRHVLRISSRMTSNKLPLRWLVSFILLLESIVTWISSYSLSSFFAPPFLLVNPVKEWPEEGTRKRQRQRKRNNLISIPFCTKRKNPGQDIGTGREYVETTYVPSSSLGNE